MIYFLGTNLHWFHSNKAHYSYILLKLPRTTKKLVGKSKLNVVLKICDAHAIHC